MQLPHHPSDEQNIVIKAISDGNVIVNSVAGSGKTTTNLFIAKEYSTKSILLLTYNSRLKIETREKAAKYGLTNLEVHSYHSFGWHYYDQCCQDDIGLQHVIKNDIQPEQPFNYDIIVLDELQDMTDLYFEFVCKVISKCDYSHLHLCILGDRKQNIYSFKGSDRRYLCDASKIFKHNDLPWAEVTLSTSFRVTDKMAGFINNGLLSEELLNAPKHSDYRVRYLITNCFQRRGMAYREIEMYKQMGYKNDDIFVLAPSVKSDTNPVRQLANALTESRIPIFVPTSDEDKLDSDVIKGKIVFSTFHQTKGLERPVVLAFGFDAFYFRLKRNLDPNQCPNELYVAATRGSEHLSIFHHYKEAPLAFIKFAEIIDYCDVIVDDKFDLQATPTARRIPQQSLRVTDLIKFMPASIISECINYLTVETVRNPGKRIEVDCITKQGDLYENVSHITGTAVPLYFERKNTGKNQIDKIQIYDAAINGFKARHKSDNPAEAILITANMWSAYVSGYYFQLRQISRYNWITIDQLDICAQRLFSIGIDKDALMEKPMGVTLPECTINGCIDCISRGDVYEFKFVDRLLPEHLIQLAIYAFIYKMANYDALKQMDPDTRPRYYLYNIRTGELLRISCGLLDLRDMINLLLKTRVEMNNMRSDDAFLDAANVIFLRRFPGVHRTA